MKIRRTFLAIVVLLSLGCNFITNRFGASSSTPQIVLETPTSIPLTPAYVPSACAGIPLATIPPATALIQPTPILQDNPQVPFDLQKQVLEQVITTIQDVYVHPDFNGNDWVEIADRYRTRMEPGLDTQDFYTEIKSMISELDDEHSRLETPFEAAEAESELAGTREFVGIGVYVLPMVDKGHVALISVFPNSPAEYGGLKSHDIILAVDGIPIVENGESQTHIVRGPQCSAVVVTVQSPGGPPHDVLFIREKIQSPLLIQASLVPASDGSRIGYIFLPTFFDQTIPQQVAAALENFGPLDGLILDNRLNGGGSSKVLEPVLSYFAAGTLGQFISRKDSRPLVIEPDPIQNSQTVPIVVLVSEETVSFGEIFAGVLKDAGRAQIVGQTTLGNVEILHGYDLADGSILWIAEETFTPSNSNENWEQTGIIPDVAAHADWDTFISENDPSLLAAMQLLGH
jgi:carboxyl-terminal processing protease